MHRIDHATAAAVRPSDAGAGTQGFWTEGSPGVVPSTVLAYDWFNMLQEELRAVVVDGGLTPTKGSETQVRDAIRAMIAQFAAPGMIGGLTLANNAGDPTNDIDFAAGLALSEDATTLLRLAAMTKRLDATWTAGSGNGGRATGITYNSTPRWYHCFVLNKTDGGIDCGFDTNLNASALLSNTGGSKYRRIGSIIGSSAAPITPFKQRGHRFSWTTPVLDVLDTNVATGSRTLYTMSVPPGVRSLINVRAVMVNGTNKILLITSPDEADQAPVTTAAQPLASLWDNGGASNTDRMTFDVMSNDSGQIGVRAVNSSTEVRIVTLGYEDSRGRWV